MIIRSIRLVTIRRCMSSTLNSASDKTPARFALQSMRDSRVNSVKQLSVDKLRERLRDLTFDQLKLRPEVVEAMHNIGLRKPSGIQALAIPPILQGRNIMCAAETGTGKTLAYLAPIVDRMRFEEDELGLLRLAQRPRALVVVPSKELVVQVLNVAKSVGHTAKFRAEGILDRKPVCKENFQGPIDLVVSTPKKLLYYIDNNMLSLSEVRHLVVDEADTLMERDFGELIRELMDRIRLNGRQCQHIFVSATIPRSLNQNVERMGLKDFVRIVTPRLHRPVPKLRQRFLEIDGHGDSKQRSLLRIMTELPPRDYPTMIFCNTHAACRNLHSWLSGLPEISDLIGGTDQMAMIHSRIPIEKRQEALGQYQAGKVSTLICTDIASRGLDTTKTAHVMLYDFPYSAIDYLHRVGRTARSMGEGKATSFVAKKDRKLAAQIQKAIRRPRLSHNLIGKMLQLIDAQKQFQSDSCKSFIAQFQSEQPVGSNLMEQGFLNYHVLAIFGSQSSGKSTLLNRLFGTQFDVMSNNVRQQTTHGIWLSKAQDSNMMVMDVEGTDGREHGEDQEFERRSALFSTAAAEVIIVNIHENNVGLYNGANMGLLKTVFEVNLSLFQHEGSPKTLLLFVIRDFTNDIGVDGLSKVIMDSLARIWSEIGKPSGKSDSSMRDYFDFQFATLAHKKLQPAEFDAGIDLLRQRFIVPNHGDYVFNPRYHRKIPIDGLPRYLQSIWETIAENKDLDLPTQRQLLAQYRCDEISGVLFQSFSTSIRPIESQIDAGQSADNFRLLQKLRDTALDSFKVDAGRYHKDVFARKRDDLAEKMNAVLHILFVGQLRNIRKNCIGDFKTLVGELLKVGGERLAEQLMSIKNRILQQFIDAAQAAILEGTNWNASEEIKEFTGELLELASKLRTDEMEKILKKLQKSAKVSMLDGLVELFATMPKDLWSQVYALYRKSCDRLFAAFLSKTASFETSDEEKGQYLIQVQESAWEWLRGKVKEELSDQMLPIRLRKAFEDNFRYDKNGLPKVWQPGQDMETCFVQARSEAEDLISLLSFMRFPANIPDDPIKEDPEFDESASSITLLSTARQRDLRERLKKDADLVFLEVKRGAIASLSEVPGYFWLVLLLFGFNEIYAFASYVLFNPFLLVILILFGGSAWFLLKSGLWSPLLSAAYRNVGPVARNALTSVGPWLGNMGEFVAETLKDVSLKIKDAANSSEKHQSVGLAKRKPFELGDDDSGGKSPHDADDSPAK